MYVLAARSILASTPYTFKPSGKTRIRPTLRAPASRQQTAIPHSATYIHLPYSFTARRNVSHAIICVALYQYICQPNNIRVKISCKLAQAGQQIIQPQRTTDWRLSINIIGVLVTQVKRRRAQTKRKGLLHQLLIFNIYPFLRPSSKQTICLVSGVLPPKKTEYRKKVPIFHPGPRTVLLSNVDIWLVHISLIFAKDRLHVALWIRPVSWTLGHWAWVCAYNNNSTVQYTYK